MGLFNKFKSTARKIGTKVGEGVDSLTQTLYTAGDMTKSGLDAIATTVATAADIGGDALLTGARVLGDDVIDYGEAGLGVIGGYGGQALHDLSGLLNDAVGAGLDVTDLVTDLTALGLTVGGGATGVFSPEIQRKIDALAAGVASAGNLGDRADSFHDRADEAYARGDRFRDKGLAVARAQIPQIDQTFSENYREQLTGFKERTESSLADLDETVTGERQSMSDTWDAFVDYAGVDRPGMSKKERDENRRKFYDAIEKSRRDNPQASASDWAEAALVMVGGGQVAKKGVKDGVKPAAALAAAKLAKLKSRSDNVKRNRNTRR